MLELQTADTLPRHPALVTSPVILKPLNVLHGHKDDRFLKLPDHTAGRQVCIVLYATNDSRDESERAWKDMAHDGVNLAELGRAAKAIETAGYNWRELATHEDVLAAAKTLPAPGARR